MRREVFHYRTEELIPFIDWSYLLHAWGVTACKAKVAKDELLRDARRILDCVKECHTHALFALCEAHSEDDNIVVEGLRLPLLRQQHRETGKPNICLSDFVSPKNDCIGLFATTVDPEFGNGFKNDEYASLLAQTLADRLAEATATVMHRRVRTDSSLWGYAKDEELSVEELNREMYQGVRPAVGYPSLPDQSIIFIIDKLLKLKEIGIELTPNGAMYPHASVCGIMLKHPAAHYFAVGRISEEQFCDYVSRHTLTAEELRRFLAKNLCE